MSPIYIWGARAIKIQKFAKNAQKLHLEGHNFLLIFFIMFGNAKIVLTFWWAFSCPQKKDQRRKLFGTWSVHLNVNFPTDEIPKKNFPNLKSQNTFYPKIWLFNHLECYSSFSPIHDLAKGNSPGGYESIHRLGNFSEKDL